MEKNKRVMALGFFDGVHIGHAALLNRTKERACELGVVPSVLTFDVHPDNLVFGSEVQLINSPLSREAIIRRNFGIDNVVFIHFSRRIMMMPWREFLDELLLQFDVCHIVCGYDFTFGFRGEGKPELLKSWCESNNTIWKRQLDFWAILILLQIPCTPDIIWEQGWELRR